MVSILGMATKFNLLYELAIASLVKNQVSHNYG